MNIDEIIAQAHRDLGTTPAPSNTPSEQYITDDELRELFGEVNQDFHEEMESPEEVNEEGREEANDASEEPYDASLQVGEVPTLQELAEQVAAEHGMTVGQFQVVTTEMRRAAENDWPFDEENTEATAWSERPNHEVAVTDDIFDTEASTRAMEQGVASTAFVDDSQIDVEHPTMDVSNPEVDALFTQEHSEEDNTEETTDTTQEEHTFGLDDINLGAFREAFREHQEAQESSNNTLQEPTTEPSILNSATITEDDTTLRFKGAPWYEIAQEQVITLAGIGGIGSWAALMFSRMHPKAMFLYDADVVESVNMAGQLYATSHIGKYKVASAIDTIQDFSNYHDVFGINNFFTVTTEPSNIMICGFDSMAARKVFFNAWIKRVESLPIDHKKRCLFIDGRMSAESIQVFCMTGVDECYIQKYKSEWLFDDIEAEHTVCSYKQTTYCAAMIGAIINNLFVNFCTNLSQPFINRDLPFMTSYEAETMYFKTEA